MAANPAWVQDELLIVLDLYLKERRVLEDYDPRVVAASDLLNRLPIHPQAGRHGFRTPDAVVLKLANFRSYDPDTPARGMTNAGRRAEQLWDAYWREPDTVRQLARVVEMAAGDASRRDLAQPEPDEDLALEGRLLYRRHRQRERDPRLRSRKLKKLAQVGCEPTCEVCGLLPTHIFGARGRTVLECHHLRPLALGERATRIDDVALVCANCHRALHAIGVLAGLDELRESLPPAFRGAMADGKRKSRPMSGTESNMPCDS